MDFRKGTVGRTMSYIAAFLILFIFFLYSVYVEIGFCFVSLEKGLEKGREWEEQQSELPRV